MVNPVLLDTIVVAIDTVTLFGNVEVLYMLFSKSLNAQCMKLHRDLNTWRSHSLKRLNTVR